MKRVVLAGASGLVGKKLFDSLKKDFAITVIGRDANKLRTTFPKASGYVMWNQLAEIENAINSSYGIINLTGAPIVGKRWTPQYKKVLRSSRLGSTQLIINAVSKVRIKPKVLINASAVGYYGTERKGILDEKSSPGKDFLAQLCYEWEMTALKAEKFSVRTVVIRSGIILDRTEGALPKILAPFKFYIGGPIGTGRQKFPWIHIDDEIGIIRHALDNNNITGSINAVAPEIITSRDLSHAIGELLQLPSVIPVPKFALKLLYGEAAQVLTTGTGVSSEKIIDLGYKFKFRTIKDALTNILS